MTQQEQTTENEPKTTSRRWQSDRRSLSRDMRTSANPHYVVITGTNIRSTLPGKDFAPKVYDSEAIAFAAIDSDTARSTRRQERIGITPPAPRSPISVEEYDRKYSMYISTSKE